MNGRFPSPLPGQITEASVHSLYVPLEPEVRQSIERKNPEAFNGEPYYRKVLGLFESAMGRLRTCPELKKLSEGEENFARLIGLLEGRVQFLLGTASFAMTGPVKAAPHESVGGRHFTVITRLEYPDDIFEVLLPLAMAIETLEAITRASSALSLEVQSLQMKLERLSCEQDIDTVRNQINNFKISEKSQPEPLEFLYRRLETLRCRALGNAGKIEKIRQILAHDQQRQADFSTSVQKILYALEGAPEYLELDLSYTGSPASAKNDIHLKESMNRILHGTHTLSHFVADPWGDFVNRFWCRTADYEKRLMVTVAVFMAFIALSYRGEIADLLANRDDSALNETDPDDQSRVSEVLNNPIVKHYFSDRQREFIAHAFSRNNEMNRRIILGIRKSLKNNHYVDRMKEDARKIVSSGLVVLHNDDGEMLLVVEEFALTELKAQFGDSTQVTLSRGDMPDGEMGSFLPGSPALHLTAKEGRGEAPVFAHVKLHSPLTPLLVVTFPVSVAPESSKTF